MKSTRRKNLLATPLIIAVLALTIIGVFFADAPTAIAEQVTFYGAITSSVITTEQITYSRYEEDLYNTGWTFPDYYNTNTSLSNTCAPVAGADIVGFYDRYCPNLMSSWASGHTVGSNYVYYPQIPAYVTYIQACIDSLYSSMGTNTLGNGTSRTQYINGLTSYSQNAGYSISFTSAMSGSIPDVGTIMTQMLAGKVVSVYLSGYTFTNITSLQSTQSAYSHEAFTGTHIVMAYGYRVIRYYDANDNNFRTDTFFVVTGGADKISHHYILIDSNRTTFDAADITYIY